MDTDRRDRLERLMAAYGTDIKRFCALELGDPALAEDVSQEVFLKAWKSMDRFRGESSEKTWLMRIAINTCRDWQRTGWFRFLDRRVTPEDLPLAAPDTGFEEGSVSDAVSSLPRDERDAVLLHYYENLTLEETASALGISLATVKRRLTRACDHLRPKLKGWNES